MTKYAVQLDHNGFGFAGYICEEIDGYALSYSSDADQALRVSLELAEALKESMAHIRSFSVEIIPEYMIKTVETQGGNNNER